MTNYRVSVDGQPYDIEIEDDGVEFNPAAYPQADIHAPLEERRARLFAGLSEQNARAAELRGRVDGTRVDLDRLAADLAVGSDGDPPSSTAGRRASAGDSRMRRLASFWRSRRSAGR